MKKVEKITRSFRHDLNQIPYNYRVEVMTRFKELDLVDRLPWRPMDRGCKHCTGGSDQNHLKEKEMQEGKVVLRRLYK